MSRISTTGQGYSIDNDPDEFGVIGSDNSAAWRKIGKSYTKPFRSPRAFGNSLLSFFPIISWLPKYSSSQLFGDAMAGLMAGVLNITQGMAYAILSGLPPVNGLYSTFIASVLFPFVTSWMHGSLGPFAIVAVMCRAAQEEVIMKYEDTNHTIYGLTDLNDLNPSVIISTLTFLVGIVCLIFGLLRLEFFAEYFSEPLVSGFITAAAVQVMTTQLDAIFGLPKPHVHGLGKMFKTIYEIIIHLPNTNLIVFATFCGSLLYLCIAKFVIHPMLVKIRKGIVIPYELIMVITVTTISYFVGFEENFNVRVVGKVPTGLQIPALPKVGLFKDLIFDAAALAVMIIAVHLSLVRLMCVKKKYTVDENQELYAFGISNLVAGFMPVFPPSTGLGRPFILDDCGGSSPISNFFSAALLLLVLLFVGPVFYWLPLCTLSAIVVIAMRNLFKGFFELPKLWNLCRWDFCVWIVTFSAAIMTDVIFGLACGIIFELFAVSARTQWPQWSAHFSKDTSTSHVCVFRLESMLLFTNASLFKKNVKAVYIKWPKPLHSQKQKTFIFDCSAMTDADFVGLKQFGETIKELRKDGCVVYLVAVTHYILKTLRKLEVDIKDASIFPLVEEAIWEANRQDSEKRKNGGNIFKFEETTEKKEKEKMEDNTELQSVV